MIDLSIVIPSFNTKELTVACVKSVLKNTKGIRFEIVVVDNGSTDGSAKAVQKQIASQANNQANASRNDKVVLIENKKNLGFSGANNKGVKKAKGKYVLFLNSDTLIEDNVLGEMVEWMESRKEVGIATCGLKNKDRSLQETGGYFPNLLRVVAWMSVQGLPGVERLVKPFHPKPNFYKNTHELDWVTGAFMLVRREVTEKIKWDEHYFMYTEDTDYCYRAKKLGWKVMYLAEWNIVHLGGASGTKEATILREYEGVKKFFGKHYPGWQYPVVRFALKIGALGRMVGLGILRGKKYFLIYAKAFWRA